MNSYTSIKRAISGGLFSAAVAIASPALAQSLAELDSDNDGILNSIENPSLTSTASLSGSLPNHFTNTTFNELFDGDTSHNDSNDDNRIHDSETLDLSLSNTINAGTVVDAYWSDEDGAADGISISLSNNGGGSYFQTQNVTPGTHLSITRTFSVTSTGDFNFIRIENVSGGQHLRLFEVGVNGAVGTANFVIPGPIDTDGDGITDDLDLDSDNDGISDLYESGTSNANILADADNNGTITSSEAADVDFDGLMDIFDQNTSDITAGASVGTSPVNSDTDLIPDYLDLDSDNDGIPDTVEARVTSPYVQNDGNVSNDDTDNDGVIALFDADDLGAQLFGGTFITPENTDGEDVVDYLDDNSDGDAVTDAIESGLTLSGNDNNNDGIDDSLSASYSDPDGSLNSPSLGLANEFGDTLEVAYREIGNITVSVVKTATPAQAISGQPISFTLTACETANTGDATNVIATDTLSAIYGLPSNPGGDVNFTYSSPTLSCDFGTIVGGSCKTCTFDVIAP